MPGNQIRARVSLLEVFNPIDKRNPLPPQNKLYLRQNLTWTKTYPFNPPKIITMAQTEILLLEKVDNLGTEGDVVKVRPGYARNFLLPKGIAVPLNQANKKRLDSLKIARAAREAEELQNAQDVASKIEGLSIAIAVKTGSGGKLFGSVTASQIIEKVSEKGFSLDKKHFNNFAPIKSLGQTIVPLSLSKEVTAELKVEVVSENPIEEEE